MVNAYSKTMNDQRWEEIKTLLTEKFVITEHDEEEFVDPPGRAEWFIFEGPMGKMKLERTQQPRVIDRKITSARRIGAAVKEEKIYSADEFNSFLRAYVLRNGEWKEIDPHLFTPS